MTHSFSRASAADRYAGAPGALSLVGLLTLRPAKAPQVARPRFAAAFLAAAVLVPAMTQAQVSAADRRFMDDAAAGGMMEIVLGRVAQERATSDPVRQFGSRMVEDHNKANEELKALAATKGVPLPTGLSSDQKAVVGQLKKRKGAGFDPAFMARMLEDHRRTVAIFDRASAAAGDADVKSFAARNLPVLRSHLEMAQQTQSGLAAAGSSGKAAARGAQKPMTRE